MSWAGPAYVERLDARRIAKQHATIRDFMLNKREWLTLSEISLALNYPEASISAQLRHLRKPKFGSYEVRKRRRKSVSPMCGLWEYRVLPKFTLD